MDDGRAMSGVEGLRKVEMRGCKGVEDLRAELLSTLLGVDMIGCTGPGPWKGGKAMGPLRFSR